jgi:hypothetical protein
MDELRKHQTNKNWEFMLSYFEKNTITITNDIFNIILITLIDAYHNLDKSHKTLLSILNYTEMNALNECSFNLTIRLCAKLNNTEKIYHLLNIMQTKEIQIKKRTITPLIHLFVETKNPDLMEIIYPLLFNGIPLDDTDYSMILSFLGEHQFLDKFETIFKLMIEQLDIISNELSSIISFYYTFRVSNSTIHSHICKKCNTSLLRDKLSLSHKNCILDIIYNNFSKKNKYFLEFIDSIHNNPRAFNVDYILDGANIGFFQQRPDKGGKLSYLNIDKIVNQLKNKGKIMVFLHEKHLNLKYMSDYNKRIIAKWENDNILYKTKRGLNDDWYWLYLGIYLEKAHIISNDKMTDHYYQCFHDKSFKRWRDMSQIEFNFIKNKVILSDIKLANNGAVVNDFKVHIPYHSNTKKVEWLCIDTFNETI